MLKSKVLGVAAVSLVLAGLAAGGCAKKEPAKEGATQQAVTLNGAGATFPYPVYSKWVSEYEKVNPNVKINYQSIGSGGGIKQISARTVDFGASDAPLTDEQLAGAPGKLLHIPTVLGADVVTWNLEGVNELKLTPDVVADIFLGKIKKWNDKRLTDLNPGAKLPDLDITVAHRSDGSGTTYVFSDYLSKVSPEWKDKVGKGTSLSWPVGVGGKGNEGVTAVVKQTPGAIGYVELIYAEQNHLPHAALRNKDGEFVKASLDGVSAAAAGAAAQMPEDLRVSITDASGKDAYPIAALTYLLVYQEQDDRTKGKALLDYIWWALHEGGSFARDLHYATLPPEVLAKAEAKLRSVTFQGQPLLQK